jgi:hypothetical protein
MLISARVEDSPPGPAAMTDRPLDSLAVQSRRARLTRSTTTQTVLSEDHRRHHTTPMTRPGLGSGLTGLEPTTRCPPETPAGHT